MGLKLMKCPSCGGSLNIDTDKNVIFCQHCGAKLMNVNERIVIEHIDRTINETENRKIAMEEKESATLFKRQIAVWIFGVVLLIAGLIMKEDTERFGNDAGYICLCLGMCGVFAGIMTTAFGFLQSIDNKRNDKK